MNPKKMNAKRASLCILLVLSFWTTVAAHDIDHAPQAPHLTADHESETRALISAFRETGDDDYLEQAWSALEPVLSNDPVDARTLVDAATIAQSRHDFESAERLIGRALIIRRNFDDAWLLRASIALVRGRTIEATTACGKLRNSPGYIPITCQARVAIARGDHKLALATLKVLLSNLDKAVVDPEGLAWILAVAGDASVGEPNQAVSFYTRSLDIRESAQVRAALVDQLIYAERYDDALDALDAGHDALPLVVRRFIVERELDSLDRSADAVSRANHRFMHWIENSDYVHAREMTRFYLDVIPRPSLAQRLAAINLDLQREPEDLLLAARAGL